MEEEEDVDTIVDEEAEEMEGTISISSTVASKMDKDSIRTPINKTQSSVTTISIIVGLMVLMSIMIARTVWIASTDTKREQHATTAWEDARRRSTRPSYQAKCRGNKECITCDGEGQRIA